MEGETLRDYELAYDKATGEKNLKAAVASAAYDKSVAADAAYNVALNNLCNASDSYGMADESMTKAFNEASKAKNSAKDEFDTANQEFEDAKKAEDEAKNNLDDKKEELRRAAKKDTNFVVHTARLECNYGTETTFFALEFDHGVTTRGYPQMLIDDNKIGENIFHFYGCSSMYNPEVIKKADEAVENTRKLIAESDDFRDKIMNFFFGKREIASTDSVQEKIIGKCICELPVNMVWEKGQENMEINGSKPILRRCKLKCIHGGTIIVLLSGQPE